MARDCPDRQRGASWRNDGRPAGRINGGDAVDREMEVCTCLCPMPLRPSPSSFFFFKKSLCANFYYSNLCKNLEEALDLQPESKLALVAARIKMERMPSPGNVDQLAALLPGDPVTTTPTTESLEDLVLRRLGPGNETAAGMTIMGTVIVTVTATAKTATAKVTVHLDQQLLPPGNSSIRLLEPRVGILDMLGMVVTLLLLVWVRRPDFPRLVPDWQLLPASLE